MDARVEGRVENNLPLGIHVYSGIEANYKPTTSQDGFLQFSETIRQATISCQTSVACANNPKM